MKKLKLVALVIPSLAMLASLRVGAQTGPATSVRSLPAITSRAEFDQLARVYTDTSYALPHVLFVIDRKDNNKIYYVNRKRYAFHKHFVNGTYLSLERGQEFFENNYLKPNRRFIMGTLACLSVARKAMDLRVLGGRYGFGGPNQTRLPCNQQNLLRASAVQAEFTETR